MSGLIDVTLPVIFNSVVLGLWPVAFGRVGVAAPPDHLRTGSLGDAPSPWPSSSISLVSDAKPVCAQGHPLRAQNRYWVTVRQGHHRGAGAGFLPDFCGLRLLATRQHLLQGFPA